MKEQKTMPDKAPTIIAKVIGHKHCTARGQHHYMHIPAGQPLGLSREDMGVIVQAPCCAVNMGIIDPAKASELVKWMDAGWAYTAVVKNEAQLMAVGGMLAVTTPMVAECTPMQAMRKGVTTKIEKPEDKQAEQGNVIPLKITKKQPEKV